MLVKLSNGEQIAITQALGLAKIFYEKLGRKEEYFEVDDLVNLLFFAGELTADVSDDRVTYYTEDAKRLKDLLAERESRAKAKEQGCRVYQFRTMPEGLDDPDDPDEVEADKFMTEKMRKIAKEHPEL